MSCSMQNLDRDTYQMYMMSVQLGQAVLMFIVMILILALLEPTQVLQVKMIVPFALLAELVLVAQTLQLVEQELYHSEGKVLVLHALNITSVQILPTWKFVLQCFILMLVMQIVPFVMMGMNVAIILEPLSQEPVQLATMLHP